ncbi:hypothetical protein T01_13249 [Trichinella spiralis]|uniref:Uncharacterized protein n=1 Tax=Trichinella spiralis TaxID=6334 RepID=A0A0V1B3A9_TRISP|nr:hypothetical protein T01_13249 [Trichinella spiralis]
MCCYSPVKLTFSSVINADPFLMKLFCLEDSSNIEAVLLTLSTISFPILLHADNEIPERERTIGVDEGLNRLKNVKVSFQLPVAAAKRLQRLNAQEPSCLRSIGILAVHVGGEHEEHDVGKDDARLIPSFSGATRRQSCEADSLATSLLRHCYSNSINNETNKRKTAARAGNGLQSRSVSSAKTSDSGISAGSSSPLLVGLLLQSGFSDGTAETSSVNISEDRSWLTGKVESSAAPVSKRRRGGSRMRKEILSPPVLNHPLKQRQQHRQLYDDSSQAREKREAIMDEVIQSVVSDMKAYSNDDNGNNNNGSDSSVKSHGELESNSVALSDEQSGTNSNNITDEYCNAEQQMLSTDANVELPTDAVQLNREDSESLSRTILPADDLSRSDSSCLVDSNCTSSTLSNVDGTTEQVDKGQLSANIVPSEGEVDGQCTMTNGERDSTVVDVRLSNGPAPRELEKKNEDELATGNSQSGDNFEQQQQHAESTSMVTNAASVMVDDCFSDRNSFLLHAVQSDHDYTEPSLLRQQGTTAGRCSNDQQQQQEEEEEEEEEKEKKEEEEQQQQQQLKSRLSTDDNTLLPTMSSLASGSDSCTAKGRVLDTSVELLSDQGQGQCQWPLQAEISSLQQQNVGSSIEILFCALKRKEEESSFFEVCLFQCKLACMQFAVGSRTNFKIDCFLLFFVVLLMWELLSLPFLPAKLLVRLPVLSSAMLHSLCMYVAFAPFSPY